MATKEFPLNKNSLTYDSDLIFVVFSGVASGSTAILSLTFCGNAKIFKTVSSKKKKAVRKVILIFLFDRSTRAEVNN